MRNLPNNWKQATSGRAFGQRSTLSSGDTAFFVSLALTRSLMIVFFCCLGCCQLAAHPSDEILNDDSFSGKLVDAAPPAFRRLIDQGMVSFARDDAALAKHGKRALTEFHIETNYEYSYRTFPGNRLDQAGAIEVSLKNVDFRVSHRVVLPTDFQADPSAWNGIVLIHEFDHVAISTDPRIGMLANQIYPRRMRLSAQLDAVQVTEKEIQLFIKRETDQRVDEIRRIIQGNYDALDSSTRDGYQALDDRAAFFQSLYSQENLAKHDFLYLSKSSSLIKQSKYRDVSKHYALIIDTMK